MESPSEPLLGKKTQRTSEGGHVPDLEDGRRRTDIKLKLHRAALNGRWDLIAAKINDDNKGVLNGKITKRGDTALHVAAAAGHTHFVTQLIQKMRPDALRIRNDDEKKDDEKGNTAFCHAAISGNVEIAHIMWQADDGLVICRGKREALPLTMAALFGHKEMVRYLYDKTAVMEDKDRIDLLVNLVHTEIYEFAIKMVGAHPALAIARDSNGETAIHALARKDSVHRTLPAWKYKINRCSFWVQKIHLCCRKVVEKKSFMQKELLRRLLKELLRYDDSKISEVIGATDKKNGNDSETSKAKNPMLQELVQLLWQELLRYNDSKISKVIEETHKKSGNDSKTSKAKNPMLQQLVQILCGELLRYNDPKTCKAVGNDSEISKESEYRSHSMFTAAAQGNDEFVAALIGSYPDFLFELDKNRRSIFHIAVLHRQEHIFRLIKKIGSTKNFIAAFQDNDKNNMLHLAAKLSPPTRLDVVPGAALQLQRELLWFEEVSKLVLPRYIEDKNKDGQTPQDIFLEEHEKLIDAGKAWMTDTASNCMIVATFIAGVAFAAGISVPGGTDGGVPILLSQTSFQVFAVADGLSLVFALSAVLFFLSIRTSRYELYSFLRQLPEKLVFGLVALFLSIAALMVAFVAEFFIVFRHGKPGFFYPIALIATFPVLLFVYQQRGLFADVIRSTYCSKSMFQPDKRPLISLLETEVNATEGTSYQSRN